MEAVSQLGSKSSVRVIIVPGSKSAGTLSRCSINETWNELKTCPEVRSHSWYAFKWGEYLMKTHGWDHV